MRFYTEQHRFYCGVDLHARTMYLCILDADGQVVYDQNLPGYFLLNRGRSAARTRASAARMIAGSSSGHSASAMVKCSFMNLTDPWLASTRSDRSTALRKTL